MLYTLVYFPVWIWLRLFYGFRVFGKENLPKGKAIIAASHASNLDPIVAGAAFGIFDPLYFIARSSLFEKPLLGKVIRAFHAYPIRRGKSNQEMIRTVKRMLGENRKVLFFPEGSRTYDGKVQIIKGGIGMVAPQVKCPIVPCYISGTYNVWSRHRRYPKWLGQISLTLGPPIYWEDVADLPKKEGQKKVIEYVQNTLYHLEKTQAL